jgi:hypothetical protein
MSEELIAKIVAALETKPQTARDLVRSTGGAKSEINSILYALLKKGTTQKDDSTAPVWSVAETDGEQHKKPAVTNRGSKEKTKSSSSEDSPPLKKTPPAGKKFVLPPKTVVFASGGVGEDDFKEKCRSFKKLGVKITVFSRSTQLEETIMGMTEAAVLMSQSGIDGQIILAFGSFPESTVTRGPLMKAADLIQSKYEIEVHMVKTGWDELVALLE